MVLSSHYAVAMSYMIVLLSQLAVLLFFFLTFDGFILILCSSNVTCDNSFAIFGGSLTFSSHLVVPSLHVTVLLLYSMVPLLFSHI